MSPFGCQHGYSEESCKCNQPLIHNGQDEAAFKQNQLSFKGWILDGYQRLRKKNDGKGEMVSAFQECLRGFGFPMTQDELEFVNAWRADRYTGLQKITKLDASPGTRYLVYGKDIYGNYERFAVQVEDLMDCFDCLYPHYQMLIEVDHSSGHTKKKIDGLSVESMILSNKHGKIRLRDSLMTSGCLPPGGNAMHITVSWRKSDGSEAAFQYPLLNVGDWQHFEFTEDDPPPFNDMNCPKHDVATADPEKPIRGYVGQAKGILQVLFERGLYKKT